MKKITFLLATALGLGSFAAQKTAQATVNVRLFPMQSIIVNTGSNVVDLEYKTSEDYKDGVSTNKADHISVFSTGAFAVSVNADKPTLESTQAGVTGNIESSDISVTASAGTTNALAGATYNTAVSLKTTPQKLFSSATGGVDKTFNVKYSAKGGNSYVTKHFDTATPTVYTTTVTYSIEAR